MSTIFERAIMKWGRGPQMIVAIEEMSELTKELCKDLNQRFDNGQEHLMSVCEEIADVQIMMLQMQHMFGFETVDVWKLKKLQKIVLKLKEDPSPNEVIRS
jgi:hypothetical protein